MHAALDANRRHFLGLCGAAATAASLPALAQGPATVRIVQGYSPGGLVDVTARMIAEAVAPLLGETVIADARPGGNGSIAANYVAGSRPDGATWLLNGLPHITNAAMGQAMQWSIDQFTGLSFVSRQPSILVAHPSLGVKTLKDLVAYGKANPGKVNFLNGGDGSISHLVPELLTHKYGAGLVSVPYKGAPAGLSDLMTGRLQFACMFPLTTVPHVTSGKLVALATVDEVRYPGLPDLPTMAEAGFPEALVQSKWFLLLPAKTPAALVESLNEKVQKALGDPKLRAQMAQQGMTVAAPSRPAEVDQYIQTSVASWKTFFKESGLKFK